MKTDHKMGYQGLRGGRNGETLVQRYKHPAIRQTSSGDLVNIMKILANNTVLYTGE